MNSISPNLNLMIKSCEKVSKVLIRDFGEVEKLQVSIKGPKNCSGPYLEPSGRCLSSEILRKTIKGIDNSSKETQRGVSKINKFENF